MGNIKFIIVKDCMAKESLPVYGNKFFKTPNIDALAKKGTVFNRHYTAGGSTNMSLSAMFTGRNCHEFTSRKTYTPVKPNEFKSIFDFMQEKGYECHIIWDIDWTRYIKFIEEIGDQTLTVVHSLDLSQPCGAHKTSEQLSSLKRDDQLLEATLKQIYDAIDSIDYSKDVFVYLHLPHVLKGKISYEDDIEVFDDIVGYVRNKVGDENIYLTTDHGHMNMHKNIVGYGFDLYEPIVCIPLITPRFEGKEEINQVTSHTQFMDLILHNRLNDLEYAICDTAYFAQENRKLTVISDRYKYIYSKKTNTEELYDLKYDPLENYNILVNSYYDKDRHSYVRYDELHFYPYRDEALKEYEKLKAHFKTIWKCGTFSEETYAKVRVRAVLIRDKLRSMFK